MGRPNFVEKSTGHTRLCRIGSSDHRGDRDDQRLSTVNYSRLRSKIFKGGAYLEIHRIARTTKVPEVTIRYDSDVG